MLGWSRYRNSDSYLASVSDLMIGLLFVFIIILMTFSLDYKVGQQAHETERVKLVADHRALTSSDQLRATILQQIRQGLERSGIHVQIDDANGVLRLPESLLFDEGSAQFRPGGVRALADVARALALILPRYSLDSVFVEGHTDDVPIASADYRDNWELSLARARITYTSILADNDVLRGLRNGKGQPLFSMAAYADTRPVRDNATPAHRAENRRIDLRFIMTPPSEIEEP